MKKYYSLETNAQTRTADLYIFGDIVDAAETGLLEAFDVDMGETSSLSIVKDLQALDVDTINVHINSMGGYVNEGLAIYNVLKNHSAKVNTIVEGFACSAASVVFMAGDTRTMNAASALMIHNAWMQPDAGNSAQLRQQADELDKISQAAGNAYMERVNISRNQLDAMLDGENHEGTWILPDDAVKMGFATVVSSAAVSNVANQSAMRQVLQKVTAKPQGEKSNEATVTLSLDTKDFYAELEKAKAAAKQTAEEINGKIQNSKKTNAERLMAAFHKKTEVK
jgi:ATP-dependent Clp protease protease subunit